MFEISNKVATAHCSRPVRKPPITPYSKQPPLYGDIRRAETNVHHPPRPLHKGTQQQVDGMQVLPTNVVHLFISL